MSGEGDAYSEELVRLARTMTTLFQDVYRLVPPAPKIASLVADHLGSDPADVPAVGQWVPVVDRPNLQLALNAILAAQPSARLVGVSPEVVQYSGFSLSSLLSGRFNGPSEPVPPTYDELPVGVDESLRCVVAGLWLYEHEGEPVAAGLVPGERVFSNERPSSRLEVFAPRADIAEAALGGLRRLRHELNVYRGKMLAFTYSEHGDFGMAFMERPTTVAADVVLPADDLASIQRHTVGVARHADALRAAGRDLKRGLLLFGPPGCGKTHTVGYLAAAMPERTVVVLQGPSVGALGHAAAIVRALPPAMLVIEDVDLIATARDLESHTNPLLFQLLNEMDGLTASEDVVFVLTTNRLDIIEPALAARPGRIDHAVEIGRPDRSARLRLVELYLVGAPHEIEDTAPVVDATAGVPASFIKELVRRAVLDAIEDGGGVVRDHHLRAACDELLHRSAQVLRAMLGADATPVDADT